MFSSASTDLIMQQRSSKKVKVRKNISRIQIEQRQIIDHLENMEKRHGKQH